MLNRVIQNEKAIKIISQELDINTIAIKKEDKWQVINEEVTYNFHFRINLNSEPEKLVFALKDVRICFSLHVSFITKVVHYREFIGSSIIPELILFWRVKIYITFDYGYLYSVFDCNIDQQSFH